MTLRRGVLAAIALLLAPCFASCSGDGEGLTGTGDLPTTGLAQIQPIFDARCIQCHAPGGIGFQATGGTTGNGLDLTSGASFAGLVNQPTFQLPAATPLLRVQVGEPDSSYLVQKISPGSPKDGDRMPLGGPFLSPGEIQLIRDWIEEGAFP